MPKKPEEWLEVASPPQKARGIFKLFLGYAPGVGKTFSMLSEALRRRSRGEDVVIGVVETHGRKGIEELLTQIEQVPRKKIEYKGTVFEEMDVDAILARHPEVVLVDELAHTNIPGSKHRKRYEDVQELLAAKIDVVSTLNIQHIESIAPVVRSITGIIVRETVPDWVPLTASETVMVDLTPEALQATKSSARSAISFAVEISLLSANWRSARWPSRSTAAWSPTWRLRTSAKTGGSASAWPCAFPPIPAASI